MANFQLQGQDPEQDRNLSPRFELGPPCGAPAVWLDTLAWLVLEMSSTARGWGWQDVPPKPQRVYPRRSYHLPRWSAWLPNSPVSSLALPSASLKPHLDSENRRYFLDVAPLCTNKATSVCFRQVDKEPIV